MNELEPYKSDYSRMNQISKHVEWKKKWKDVIFRLTTFIHIKKQFRVSPICMWQK